MADDLIQRLRKRAAFESTPFSLGDDENSGVDRPDLSWGELRQLADLLIEAGNALAAPVPSPDARPWCQICGKETAVYCADCQSATTQPDARLVALVEQLEALAVKLHKRWDDAPSADAMVRLEELDDVADALDALLHAAGVLVREGPLAHAPQEGKESMIQIQTSRGGSSAQERCDHGYVGGCAECRLVAAEADVLRLRRALDDLTEANATLAQTVNDQARRLVEAEADLARLRAGEA